MRDGVSLSEADSDRFYGRDDEVQEALERLRLHPFLAVIGLDLDPLVVAVLFEGGSLDYLDPEEPVSDPDPGQDEDYPYEHQP